MYKDYIRKETFFFNGLVSCLNMDNGKIIHMTQREYDYDFENIIKETDFNEKINESLSESNPTIFICLNLSNQCNLRCRYCFNINKSNNFLDIEKAKRFIDIIISYTPKAHKYFIDMSGSGEPLLCLDFIKIIADFCRYKSDELGKEIVPMFVTNGTLLTSDVVKMLQENHILFGISIDGLKKIMIKIELCKMERKRIILLCIM